MVRAVCLSSVLLLALCLGCSSEPEPGPLQAGSASQRIPAPVGIGTVGYGGFGGPSNPSPYAESYPATERIHGHPRVTAIALSRGPGFELILVRTDMIAVVQQLRDAVLAELEQRTGTDYDDALVISATHTHSGPGRFIQGGLFHLIADYFVPEFYETLVAAVADVIEQALSELGPAELGYASVDAADAHSDRRCEDGVDYTNDTLGMVVVRKEGRVTALALSYAIHGTVLGLDDFTLSADVAGAIEERVAQRFEEPVDVILLNSWAGDVAPESPGIEAPAGLSEQPGGYDRMEEIGGYLADVVESTVGGVATSSEPELRARTYRYPIGRQSIGYEWGEFDYEWGAVYCQAAETCDEVLDHPSLVDGCVPFPENSPAPDRSVFTVGAIAGAHFTTWGGEASTGLAEEVLSGMAQHVSGDLLFFGYGNDYLGYQLQEADWWHGGYEASGSMWGPRQGEYMKEVQAEVFAHWAGVTEELSFEQPSPPPAFELTGGRTWTREPAIDAGVVSSQPAASVGTDGVVSFTVQGADPGYGAPLAVLQLQADGGFEDVRRPGGALLDSDGYGFWVDLLPTPSYEETLEPSSRVFAWSFHLPVSTRSGQLSSGSSYRFRVGVPLEDGSSVELSTEPFQVE